MSNRAASKPTTAPMPTATPVAKSTPKKAEGVCPERVAQRAYELWQKRGCPHGSDHLDWFEAEKQISAEANGVSKR